MTEPTSPFSVPSDQPTMPPVVDAASETATIPPISPDSAAMLAPTGALPAPVDARAPAGYVIERELGRGGMGVVYLARHLGLDRPCALKMILSGPHSGDAEVERFKTEARAIARLQHPGIVQVFEIGEHDGKPFLALELCAGGSLDTILSKNPLEPRKAAELVWSLAEAMQAAHAAHVLHRDLKPGNVLLAGEGQPKITDFGLAKKLDEQGATRTGSVMGTPSYMPPEQARGDRDVGPAADIYSLGAILYECLAGRPPFRAATAMETLLQVVNDEPVPLRQLNASVPRDLETIVHKCLQKDAKKRYTTARDLADDLRRFLAGEPVQARPVGSLERGFRWMKRNPVVSALLATVLLVLTAGVATSWALTGWALSEKGKADEKARTEAIAQKKATKEALAARKAEGDADREAKAARKAEAEAKEREKAEAEARGQARREAERAEREKVRAEDQLRRAEWSVYAGKLLLAQAAFTENNVPDAFRYLDECQLDLRGWEHAHLRWRFDSSKQTFQGHTAAVVSVCFSLDGQRILTGGYSPTPNGPGEVKVWDADKGTELFALKGHTRPVSSVAFSPDGKRILTGSGDQTAKVWDAQKGQEILTLKGHTAGVSSVAWSPDGKRILTGSTDRTAKVWDAETGQELLALKGHTGLVLSVSWSPDGKRILTGSLDKTAKIWDAQKSQENLALKGHADAVSSVAWSPDGKRILSGSLDQTAKVWDAQKGQEILTLKGHTHAVSSVAWSPDGTRVFARDVKNQVLAWSTEDGKPVDTVDPLPLPPPGPARAPDGFHVATPRGNTLAITDTRQPPHDNAWPSPDAAERQRYHGEQAALAEKEQKWFAAAFHLGRLLLDAPDDAGLKKRRDAALQSHAANQPGAKE